MYDGDDEKNRKYEANDVDSNDDEFDNNMHIMCLHILYV